MCGALGRGGSDTIAGGGQDPGSGAPTPDYQGDVGLCLPELVVFKEQVEIWIFK